MFDPEENLKQLELDLCDTEEAHYWHTLYSFCDLVLKYGIDQIIEDMGEIVKTCPSLT